MKIHLLAVGRRMPAWVDQGYQDFAKRLGGDCRLILHEIPPGKRGKNFPIKRIVEDEGKLLLESIPKATTVVALDVTGSAWSTLELSRKLRHWLQQGRDISLLVGGPDGLSPACLQRADASWSLSPLTFPHTIVRIILAEQLYRAWSMLHNHPYHRA